MERGRGKSIIIDPVTRIEGHAKITLHLDDRDEWRMRISTSRSSAALRNSARAGHFPRCRRLDGAHLRHLSGEPPDGIGQSLRCDSGGAHSAQPPICCAVSSNWRRSCSRMRSASFISRPPTCLLGMDADPPSRNIFGVLEKRPQLARDGIRLRQFGQQIIERLGGKRIHPAWVVPGGVSEPLTEINRDAILSGIPEALAIAERTLEWFKSIIEDFRQEIATFGNFPTLFMGIVKKNGGLDLL